MFARRGPVVRGYVGPVARTRSTAAATPSRHGSPWPTATTSAERSWSFVSESRHVAELTLNARGISCGPRAPENGLSVQNSSPTINAPALSNQSEQWPDVWPGVWMTRGRPGTSSVSPSE
jgi:hypothetical protein